MPLANETPGVHERCGLACQAAGIAAVNAAYAVDFLPKKYEQFLSRFPDPNSMPMPCGCFFFNDAEQVQNYSTHRDLIGFPIHWGILDRNIEGRDTVPRELLKLREVTADALRNLPLNALDGIGQLLVPESHLVEWVPEKVIDERFADLAQFKHLFSTMTFICWCKRTRGLKS